MIGTILSHYRIEAELGRGGMGVVYRAVDTRLDRTVAVKVLPRQRAQSEDARARFIQEAKTASALDHPSICAVHDIGEAEDGSTFMVMPFYDGETLAARLARGAIAADEAGQIAAQIADGLAAAHAAGIVHRDVKPANVMLTRDGRVKILDFGVAKMAEGVALTLEGSTVGTAFYMSPEQARGEQAIENSDLWSLGVVLYEMLAGRRPFRGDYDAAAAYAIVNEDPQPLPFDVPPDLRSLVDLLLQKDPAERPSSAGDVAKTLSGRREPATPASGKRYLLPAILIAVFAVAAIGYSVVRPSHVTEGILEAIVILPFDVQAGPELAYLERGMVSMISPMIDGLAGMRAVDPKAVIGLVEQRDDRFIDPEEGRAIAASLAADRFVLGSIAQEGRRLQLSATLYDRDGGVETEAVETVDSEEELLVARNRLMIALLGPVLEQADVARRLDVLASTESFQAMKAFVRAEEAYRAGRFEEAIALGDEAIGQDSTFAAALNLAASARSQILRPVGDLRRRALRHSQHAPPRLREYIRIRVEAGEVGGQETLRRMKALLERYPDDLDVMGYVADQTYHQNPRHGRSDQESIPLFLRILQFDPDNGEYLYHLAPMLYREGMVETLDSLYRSLRARSRLEYFRVIEGYRNMALANRSAVLDSAIARDDSFAGATMVGSHDVEAAEIVLRSTSWSELLYTGDPVLYAAGLALVRGRIAAWDSAVTTASPDAELMWTSDPVWVAAWMRWLPMADESLAELSRRAPDYTAADVLRAINAARPMFRYDRDDLDMRLYTRALLAERTGDLEWLRAERDSAHAAAQVQDASRITRNVAADLEARVLLSEGQTAEALAALDLISPGEGFVTQAQQPVFNGFRSRYLRARILMELGRYDDAIQWSQSVHEELQAFQPVLLPMTYELEADAHERLGEWDRAVERYDRLLHLWKDADPIFRPQIDEIVRRRDQAIGRLSAG